MINSKLNTKFINLIDKGKEQVKRTGKQVLVSSVSEIKRTDLPAFFASHGDRFAGNRFFWSEPGRKLSFVGLGSVMNINGENVNDRFGQIERAWHEVIDHCLVEDQIPEHTGPLLFGGFSFDPDHKRSELWQDFPHSGFVVPAFMLTQDGERAWLTTNVMLSPQLEDQEQLDFEEFHSIEKNPIRKQSPPGEITMEEFAPTDWMNSVQEAANSIRNGQLEKVVLARQIGLKSEQSFDVEFIINRLLDEQIDTYVFGIDWGSSFFVGATPERLIKRTGKEFLTLSLAGSIGRGRTTVEDEQLGDFLIKDVKNQHEHILAVQMIKGVMAELCERVDSHDTPTLRKLKDIQHLATPISGQAREGVSLLRAVAALHPTPALGGMPVEAAVKAIRSLEDMDRGWYAAPIGWINRNMDGEFVAAIRSALVQGNEAVLFAGCGIVGDSDPVSEYQETALKFKPMLAALQALESSG